MENQVDEIRKSFGSAEKVVFFARNQNFFQWRSVGIPGAGSYGLKKFFSALGIIPQELRSIFCQDGSKRIVIKKKSILSLLGLRPAREETRLTQFVVPEIVQDYDELGSFWLEEKSFSKLARVLSKPIEVILVDPMYFDRIPLFTAHPDGRIERTEARTVTA